jgi:hypothetical protein
VGRGGRLSPTSNGVAGEPAPQLSPAMGRAHSQPVSPPMQFLHSRTRSSSYSEQASDAPTPTQDKRKSSWSGMLRGKLPDAGDKDTDKENSQTSPSDDRPQSPVRDAMASNDRHRPRSLSSQSDGESDASNLPPIVAMHLIRPRASTSERMSMQTTRSTRSSSMCSDPGTSGRSSPPTGSYSEQRNSSFHADEWGNDFIAVSANADLVQGLLLMTSTLNCPLTVFPTCCAGAARDEARHGNGRGGKGGGR